MAHDHAPDPSSRSPVLYWKGLQCCCLGDWEDLYDADSKHRVEYREQPQTRTIIFCLSWFVLVMCLAVPGLVESVDGRTAIVDFGGVKREAIIDLMEEGTIVPGVYVLVHTGFVIQKLEKEEALETLAIWREVLTALDEP